MISRIASILLAVAVAGALHVMHEYVLCGIFAVVAAMHLMLMGAVMADPNVFD